MNLRMRQSSGELLLQRIRVLVLAFKLSEALKMIRNGSFGGFTLFAGLQSHRRIQSIQE